MSKSPKPEPEKPATSASAATQTHTRTDDTFYVEVDHIVFLVEDTLFKVSRYPFAKGSSVFATMFELPRNETLSEEGRSDSNPVTLPGVTAADFKAFLRIIHPLDFPTFEVPSYGVAEWASVLRLARLWAFDSVGVIAALKLNALLKGNQYPLEAVLLGREFKRTDWLLNGYTNLIQRGTSLTDEEAMKIGWTSAAKVWRSRENAGTTIPPEPSSVITACTNNCGNTITANMGQTPCSSCGINSNNLTLCWRSFTASMKTGTGKTKSAQPKTAVEELFAEEVAMLK